MVHLADRVCQSGGALGVVRTGLGMYRSHVVGDGLALLSAVQGSVGAQAHGNVAAYRVNARVELAAADGRSADEGLAVALEDEFEQIICVVIIVAVVCTLELLMS